MAMVLSSEQIEQAAEDLAGMANAKQLEILTLLLEREYAVGELVDRVSISQSALSQHLAKLRSLDLVSTRRDAQTVYYSCRSAKVIAILAALKHLGFGSGAFPVNKFPACRVLIIEDDFYLAQDVKALFEAAGASVVGPAAREEDALSLLEDEAPDLAIVDLNLGQGIGFAIAEQLQQQKIPFCIMTGYKRDELTAVPGSLNDAPWIVKPVIAHALLNVASTTLVSRAGR